MVRTRGPQGVAVTSQEGNLFLEAMKVAAVDATGAGDCFIGVFAAALDRGATVSDALRRANVAAALSCTRRGSQASLPNAVEIDDALSDCPTPADTLPGIPD